MKKILAWVLVCIWRWPARRWPRRARARFRMGTNAAFPPYEYYDDETGEIVGIDAEGRCGDLRRSSAMTSMIVDMEFSAIFPAITSGKVDFGMAGMTVTEERLSPLTSRFPTPRASVRHRSRGQPRSRRSTI